MARKRKAELALAARAELSDQARACLELDLLGTLSTKDIAQQLQVTPGTVSRWRQLPPYRDAMRAALTGVRERAADVLGLAAEQAAEVVVQAANGALPRATAKVQLAASQYLLDTAGLGPVHKSQVQGVHVHVGATDASPESVAAALERLRAKRTPK